MRRSGMAGLVLCVSVMLTLLAFSPTHAVNVGDHIYFGHYEQDNNRSNGPEKIEWIVLAKDNDRCLLISKDALDSNLYNKKFVPITWEKCSLRSWLNYYFYNVAFTEKEKECILESSVSADKNPKYDTASGNDTLDKVFLLSLAEVQRFFADDKARECMPTPFAEAHGALLYKGTGSCWWWLRSPGYTEWISAFVNFDGGLNFHGRDVIHARGAVRPALWIHQ